MPTSKPKRYDTKGQSTRDLMGTQYKLGRHKGQFNPDSSSSVQARAAETRKEHNYLLPLGQHYMPPKVEIEIRQGLYLLPSELVARGFEIRLKPFGYRGGCGLPVLPEIRYHQHQGRSYVGFSVR